MIIIGLTGRKGSGKDTAADYLVRAYDFQKLSFAAPLKHSAAACFGIDHLMWEDLKNESGAKVTLSLDGGVIADLTARQFLQNYGTEAHREIFGENFWIDNLGLGQAPEGRYVIPDTRFSNEATEVIRVGGSIVEIERASDPGDLHASEVPLDPDFIDAKIENYGAVEDLWLALDQYVRPFLAHEAQDAASEQAAAEKLRATFGSTA